MLILNGVEVIPTIFPDKTSQVWKLPEEILIQEIFKIEWSFSSEADIFHLVQLKTLLDTIHTNTELRIKYLPYGRQDKIISNNSTFALTPFSKILNTLNFKVVYIHDPHSQVALDLIQNSIAAYPIGEVLYRFNSLNTDLLCYPDKGAVSKYTQIYTKPYIYGEKVRDQLTGNILKYEVIGDAKNKNILIVDDICDGGMTFKLLAQDLLRSGAKEVNLFITHGIFSKGIKTLKESGINHIFTQDGEKE